jgi:hypothetical protein
MGQMYIQKFEYRGAISKAEYDHAWTGALKTFAEYGNWGAVDKGVRHIKTYGTSWGGYALLEVDDPAAFARYQAHHTQNYAHIVTITFEPVFDLDAEFARK